MAKSPFQCWIVTPSQAKRLPKGRFLEGAEWCYLGTELSRRDEIAREGFLGKRMEVAEPLTRTAYRLKQPFLDWITEIGSLKRDSSNWWSSRLATKSTLVSDLFLLVCSSELVRSWVEGSEDSPPRVVVVEEPWLLWMLRRRWRARQEVVFLFSPWGALLKEGGELLLRIPWRMGASFRWILETAFFSRLLFPVQLKPNQPAGKVLLLFSWIEERCFKPEGKFEDPYTGRLEGILRREGKTVVRLSSLYVPPRLLFRLKRVSSPFLVASRAVRWSDGFLAFGSWFRIHGLSHLPLFQGWDYTPLIVRELIQEWGDPDFVYHQVFFRVMNRLAARWGDQASEILYPFENQPWEKLLCLAWKKHAPQVKRIGYQHSWVPPLLLPYSLGSREARIAPLPDWIVTNSSFNREILIQGGFPPERLIEAGALRHEYFYSGQVLRSLTEKTEPKRDRPRQVLVTLPLSPAYSRALLSDFLKEFQAPLTLGESEGPVRFFIKCHPRLPVRRFFRGRLRLPEWISFSAESMDRMIPSTDLLVYAGPTSSWWEALLSGIPVLKYQPDLMDIDAGRSAEGMEVPVCSRGTLRFSIEAALKNPPPRVLPPGHLERFFGPVQEERWRQMVEAP